jgi:transposase
VPFGKGVPMRKKFPEEFQRDVAAVARRGGATRAEVAANFGISESTLKRWLAQADVDDGIKDEPTTAELNELVQLRRRMRRRSWTTRSSVVPQPCSCYAGDDPAGP